MELNLFGGNTKDIIKVYEIAYRLARRHGKKPGERFDEEFWEVTKRKEMKHKFRELKDEHDLNQYLKGG